MPHKPIILLAFGTRPEVIKLAPVLQALSDQQWCSVRVVSTGQHTEMLKQMLDVFNITPDFELGAMQPAQSLSSLAGRLLPAVDEVIEKVAPSAVIVQGDTTTALMTALASFHQQVPVGHIEAGLRTSDRLSPFPEEINRRLISVLSTWHFAPTERNRADLLREGLDTSDILVSGNPVIDSLHMTIDSTTDPLPRFPQPGHRLVLVTAHRRESFGLPFESMCRAIVTIVDKFDDVEVCFPVHLNPHVQEPVHRILGGHSRIHLLQPLDYVAFSHLLAKSHIVLTDSGGVQEEAPALGEPVLVMRDKTERPEAIESGTVRLVGTNEERIVQETSVLLENSEVYRRMARVSTPYGDGQSSQRIAHFLRTRLAQLDNEAAT